jgi:phenylalanyl-tRNA synthetase beta subunit
MVFVMVVAIFRKAIKFLLQKMQLFDIFLNKTCKKCNFAWLLVGIVLKTLKRNLADARIRREKRG